MKEKVRAYKCINQNNTISSILIKDNTERICAYMIPVTEMIYEYPSYIEKMVQWRQDNPTVSNNYFQVTKEGTEKWIRKVILEDDKKVFFIIFDKSLNPVGQMGISNLKEEEQSGFIYAVIKGDKNAQKGIMEHCLRGMMAWAKRELHICNFYLDVQETNDRAIALYQRIGFEQIKRIPLEKKVSEKEINWVVSENPVAERYDVRMSYIICGD